MARFIPLKDHSGSSEEKDPERCGIGRRKTSCRACSHPVDKWQGLDKDNDSLLAQRGAACPEQVLREGAGGEPECSVRTLIWGVLQLSAHLLAWLEPSWSCLCLPSTTAGGGARAFQEPSGEGQFDLRDLFSFKKFPKAQVIAQKGRDSINFGLVCCSLSSAAFIIILVSALVLKMHTIVLAICPMSVKYGKIC